MKLWIIFVKDGRAMDFPDSFTVYEVVFMNSDCVHSSIMSFFVIEDLSF